MKDIRFDGRVAIVTGAGNGLGRAYALALAERGAAVVVNDLGVSPEGTGGSKAVADSVVAEIVAAGGVAVASYDSVATRQGAAAIVARAVDAFGKIDILINNAGIVRHRPFPDQTDEDFDLTIAIHLMGTIYVTQAAWPHMVRAGYGRIVFTGSQVGSFGLPWGSAYAAAKGGTIGLMNVLAIEGESHGILCNAVLPGAATRMDGAPPEQIPAEMREVVEAFRGIKDGLDVGFVAPMVLYLASEGCSVTHSTYSAIGGRYAEVFTGLTSGWQGPLDRPVAPSEIEARLGRIRDRSSYIVPQTGVDELRAITQGRG